MSTDSSNLSLPLRDLISFLGNIPSDDGGEEKSEQEPPFFLSQISDQAGVAYEKIRSAVDNKEEHFLRRHAIRRIAKRVMWFSEDPKTITTMLLRDLYRGGYLPKRSVSRATEDAVMHTITAFLHLSLRVEAETGGPEFIRLRSRLLDIIAGAIEDTLYPTHNEEATVATLARITLDSLDLAHYAPLAEEKKTTLVYIASWRSLFGADTALLVYKLWRLQYPNWEQEGEGGMQHMAQAFPQFVTQSQLLLEHAFGKKLVPRMRNVSVAMLVLYELIKRYGPGISTLTGDREGFDARIRDIILTKYREDIARASRRAWRAVIYIFCTKTLLALAVESVAVSVFKQSLNYLAILINIFFHPILLFVLTLGLTSPRAKNTERLVALIGDIVYGGMLPRITVKQDMRGIMNDIAFAVYVAILGAMLFGITEGLDAIGFHAIDIGFFMLFLALVLYFGFRIRVAARRMELSGQREGFLRSLLELSMLPIVSVGRFLVTRFERLNFIAIFLDFFIELPLKLVLEFFDSFSAVLKEKKEEMYS